METIIIHTEPKKMKALKSFFEAFSIPFEVKKTKDSPYNPDFVSMVKESAENPGGRFRSFSKNL